MAATLQNFAGYRCAGGDVFWLKENIELLNISEGSQVSCSLDQLQVHQSFYDTVERRLSFSPQYYGFLLSITQDLDSIGVGRGKLEVLASWIFDQGLASAELSNLQLAEA